jgi:hypothetical protein
MCWPGPRSVIAANFQATSTTREPASTWPSPRERPTTRHTSQLSAALYPPLLLHHRQGAPLADPAKQDNIGPLHRPPLATQITNLARFPGRKIDKLASEATPTWCFAQRQRAWCWSGRQDMNRQPLDPQKHATLRTDR